MQKGRNLNERRKRVARIGRTISGTRDKIILFIVCTLPCFYNNDVSG